MLNKILDTALLIAIVIAAVVTVVTAKTILNEPKETAHEPTTVPTVVVTQGPTQGPTETTQPPTEATEPPKTTEETEPSIVLYEVPLSMDLQLFIIGLAESNGIAPEIVFAMIFRESTFNPSAIGDNGNSFGLMQIQPKWNYELMEELECLDLLDPYQNVTVGIAILADHIYRYDGDIAKALTAYNRGFYEGTVTQYALNVLATAEELRGTAYEWHI